jgi:hypothetical protein
MKKSAEYQEELTRWNELFAEKDDETKKAAEGLIQKAAFLHSMCFDLEQTIELSGAIKVHPQHPELQKQVPAVKEYARLSESYASITNKLNSIRLKATVEEDDDLDEYS